MTRTEKVLVHGSTWAVAGSGFVYGWMKYFMRSDDPYSVIHHPWQPLALAWHVVAAPLLVFAVGLVAQDHILSRMKDGAPVRGRGSGLAAALIVVPMVLSGYGLQVVVEPGPRRLTLAVHLATSVLFFLTYAVHVVLARLPARRPRGEAAEAAAAPNLVPLPARERSRREARSARQQSG